MAAFLLVIPQVDQTIGTLGALSALSIVFLIVLAVLWTVLPFLVISMNTKLHAIRAANREMLDLIREQNSLLRLVARHLERGAGGTAGGHNVKP